MGGRLWRRRHRSTTRARKVANESQVFVFIINRIDRSELVLYFNQQALHQLNETETERMFVDSKPAPQKRIAQPTIDADTAQPACSGRRIRRILIHSFN